MIGINSGSGLGSFIEVILKLDTNFGLEFFLEFLALIVPGDQPRTKVGEHSSQEGTLKDARVFVEVDFTWNDRGC